MLDRTRGFPAYERPRRPERFLLTPTQHRRAAHLLRQAKDNPQAAELAAHHEFLAKAIQQRLNESGRR